MLKFKTFLIDPNKRQHAFKAELKTNDTNNDSSTPSNWLQISLLLTFELQ